MAMKTKITFTACEFLDFNDNYMAKKELISSGGATKVVWNRLGIDESFPKLVQFCKKHGRMNNPESCLCEKTKGCNDYKDFEHIVEVEVE